MNTIVSGEGVRIQYMLSPYRVGIEVHVAPQSPDREEVVAWNDTRVIHVFHSLLLIICASVIN